MPTSTAIQRALQAARIDLKPSSQPTLSSVGIAGVVALGGSIGVDALLVALGTALFPSTRGFTHFRFIDYGLLTAIGVLLACAAWPVTARLTSSPRWVFLRLAVVVSLALWLPDIWILVRGEPAKAVVVLMVMHLAIAIITYNAIVHIAVLKPSWPAPAEAPVVAVDDTGIAPDAEGRQSRNLSQRQAVWLFMLGLVGLEFVLGVAALLFVPAGRPSGWVPRHGTVVYGLHTALGALLGAGAVVLMVAARRAERPVRVAAVIGLVGVVIGGVGGVLTVDHALRLLGMALMFVGPAVAVLGYVMPAAGPPEL
jgi:hypothetical protein